MARANETTLLGALAALLLAGCSPKSAFHEVMMKEGTATFDVSSEGIVVSGSFTLETTLDDDTLGASETSEVYLHHLGFSRDFHAFERTAPHYEGFDATILSADVPLPFEVEVGAAHRARFHWRASLPAMPTEQLCPHGLRAEVYLSLGDELRVTWLQPSRLYGHGYEPLEWTPDPCPSN